MPHLFNRLLLRLSHCILRQPGRPLLLGLIIALFAVLPVISPSLTAPLPPTLPSGPILITLVAIDISITGLVNGFGVRMLTQFGRSIICGAIFTFPVVGGVFSDGSVAVAVKTGGCRCCRSSVGLVVS